MPITTWLQRCTEEHDDCRKTASGRELVCSSAPLPSRCIKVQGIRQAGEFTIKAALEKTKGLVGTYITLTHRWNSSTNSSKTTSQNYDDRVHGIELGSLPQAFTDALLVAFNLGVEYVWIDSICIIQDGNDWDLESRHMAQYYQSSLLTIAIALPSPENGLWSSETSALYPPKVARLPYRDRSGEQAGFFYLYKTDRAAYQRDIIDIDIMSRGWIFQEWFLSRRIVCFSSHIPGNRLFFQCQVDDPQNEVGDTVNSSFRDRIRGTSYRLGTVSPRSMWRTWETSVREYSKRSFTKPSCDRVKALAGIATEARYLLQSFAATGRWKSLDANECPAVLADADDPFLLAYAAGSWIRNIHMELLWMEDHKSQERESGSDRLSSGQSYSRERLSGIPTWSWASLLIPVKWDWRDQISSSKSASCRLDGIANEEGVFFDTNNPPTISGAAAPNEFDIDCKFAMLHLTGRLIPVRVGHRLGDQCEAWNRGRAPIEEASFESRELCSSDEIAGVCGWGLFEHPDYQNYSRFRSGGVQAFPVCKERYTAADEEDSAVYDMWSTLFLKKTMIDGEEYFERLGSGRLFGKWFADAFTRASEASIVIR